MAWCPLTIFMCLCQRVTRSYLKGEYVPVSIDYIHVSVSKVNKKLSQGGIWPGAHWLYSCVCVKGLQEVISRGNMSRCPLTIFMCLCQRFTRSYLKGEYGLVPIDYIHVSVSKVNKKLPRGGIWPGAHWLYSCAGCQRVTRSYLKGEYGLVAIDYIHMQGVKG